MPRTHQDRDCASDHDRESVVRRLRLFPTRAIDIHVTVCTLEAPEQYRIHRLAAKLKVDEYWQDLDHRNSYMTIDNVCSQHAKGCDQPLEYCSGEEEKDGKHEVHML
jgi:hypothetical protein